MPTGASTGRQWEGNADPALHEAGPEFRGLAMAASATLCLGKVPAFTHRRAWRVIRAHGSMLVLNLGEVHAERLRGSAAAAGMGVAADHGVCKCQAEIGLQIVLLGLAVVNLDFLSLADQ